MPRREEIKDEPGAEERFLRGVRKAVNTPPKPFTPSAKDKAKRGLATIEFAPGTYEYDGALSVGGLVGRYVVSPALGTLHDQLRRSGH